MKFTLRLAASLVLALIAPMALQAQAVSERGPRVFRSAAEDGSTARVIVRFKAGSGLAQALAVSRNGELRHAAALSQRLGITLADGHSIDERTQVVHASGISSETLAQRLAQDADVESATVDRRRHILAAPNDPFYASATSPAAGQWYLRNSDSTLVSAINAEAAWAVTNGSSSVIVAVLDTGVRKDHPDLAGKLLAGYDFISADSAGVFNTAGDGDGRDADASDPGDFDPTDSTSTSSWHGTQTAGLVGAATNNGIGMASIGRNVMVLPLRVLGRGGGYDSDIQAAMLWAAGIHVPGVPDNTTPAKVISMSLGATGTCTSGTGYPTVITQVRATGAVIVASAGNDGLAVNEPANCTGVVAVGGVRHTGTKVGYSSLGPQVAISAPAGNCVNTSGACLYPLLTTTNSGTTVPATNTYSDGLNDPSIGTSFSAPLVSGTLALMFSANPTLSATQAVALLKSSARAFPTTGAGTGVVACHAPTSTAQDECYCTTSTCGAGLLDAGAAVAAAAAAAVPTVTASITTAATTVVAGSTVSLSAASSTVPSGRSIASYQWALSGNSAGAAFTGATDQATAAVSTASAGSFTITLTVTDSGGTVGSASQAFTVTGQSTGSSGSSGGDGGGGGGGALGAGWLLLLAGAVAALRRRSC